MVTALFLISLLLPFRSDRNFIDEIPLTRIDERDTMFSRNELMPNTTRYRRYYEKNPDKIEPDELFRNEPGLLKKGSRYYHEQAFKEADENFNKIELLYGRVAGAGEGSPIEVDTKTITKSIKKYCLDLGALAVGITQSKDYHYYSHKGRREEYDNEIVPVYKYAIAFTVEMDAEMVAAAPQASIVLESSRQYLNAGTIAVELAEKIRSMGYEARAHIDGNYQVVCPLVARDAGLGEIGRIGILMTPEYGPRVRIGVVTTNLDLEPDEYKRDYSMLEFCKWCKKCAESCPGNSISNNNPELIQGVKRWQINQESCFTYWCKAGTDCGRCMAVCPYSHPNYSLHKIIRFGIKRSKVFRYLAVYLDDYFYGRKPKIKKLPFK
ncbi:MAG: 4Fe-4S dicluster domain-containing protein [Bacteroidales bacterium]|nr:4Fe-4S dicluster domain-containing protein [Bacteroidales bacterium]